MRLLYALCFVFLASAAYAQQPNQARDLLATHIGQLEIQSAESISTIKVLQAQIEDLKKQLEEAKKLPGPPK